MGRTLRRWKTAIFGAGAAGALLLFVSCSSGDGSSGPVLGEQRHAVVTSFTFQLPRGATPQNTALAAIGDFLHVNDGAQIVSASPGIPGVRVLPVIASNGLAQVGVAGFGGAIISRGNVWLRGGQAGSVTTGGVLERQAGSNPGNLEEHAVLNPAEQITVTLDLPTVNLGPRQTTQGGPPLVLAPARYDRVTVSPQTELRLQAGTYSFEALIMEPGSILRLDNSGGTVAIHIRSEFIYRGTITETVPAAANVVFVYVGTSSVPIERAFRGTLVAPNAFVMISGTETTHVGAIFGRRVELHQRHVFQHRPLRSGPAPVCDVANFTPMEDHPFDRSRDIDNDHQGVTHSDDTWYFTNAHSSVCFTCLPPLVGPFCPRPCLESHIWSFGVAQDVNASNPPVLKGNPWEGRYNHFGDITFVPAAGAVPPFIHVALEAGTGGIAQRGGIGVITSDLEFHRGFGVLPVPGQQGADQGGSMPWVTFNRIDQLSYSSAFDSTWLNAYRVTVLPAIAPDGTGAQVEWVKSLRFRDCSTGAPVSIRRMQGAGFSPTGKLYISVDVQGGGVIVVDPNTGAILDFAPVNFDPSGEDEELEGVTIWDREDLVSPGIRGHVHVQMVQNDTSSNDNFYFKHLLADDFGKL